MAIRTPLVNVMARAAEKAGRSLVRDFGEVENLQVSRKGPADFVSAADHKAEQTLRAELAKARPAFGFLMEESGAVAGAAEGGERWIVDPLDGTSNFLHGIPFWCISIGVERQGEVIAGVIYNPVFDELYWAEKGRGAYLNDRRLRVSPRRNLADCLFGVGAPFAGHGDPVRFGDEMIEFLPKIAGIRRLGSAALDLAYVASGRFDAYWEGSINAWDVAAGIVLVTEAGGFVTEADGKRDPLSGGSILAANPHLHMEVLRGLKAARDRARTRQAG